MGADEQGSMAQKGFLFNIRGHSRNLSVVYTDQCPYQIDAVNEVRNLAEEQGLTFNAVRISNAKEIRDRSPTAYGVFSIIYDGRLISYCYQKKSKLLQLMQD